MTIEKKVRIRNLVFFSKQIDILRRKSFFFANKIDLSRRKQHWKYNKNCIYFKSNCCFEKKSKQTGNVA